MTRLIRVWIRVRFGVRVNARARVEISLRVKVKIRIQGLFLDPVLTLTRTMVYAYTPF